MTIDDAAITQEQPKDLEDGSSAQEPTSNGSASSSGNPDDSGTPGEHRGKLERKLSISHQAQDLSSGKHSAPYFLRWLEFPFRVKNPNTLVTLDEATGHAMDVSARGPINQSGSFVGSAMMRLAAAQAGGPNMKVYGIQASSVLTVGSVIVGVTAGITMPLVGAIVDHTDHRKAMGSISALIVVLSVGLQIMLSSETWFACFIFEAIGGYALIMHQVCTMAYLPDLTHDFIEMAHYTSRFMMNQYLVQGAYTTLVIVISFSPLALSNLDTARLAAGVSALIGVIFFGYSWIFLFRKRPRLRVLAPGANLYTTGFKQLLDTTKFVFKNYKALKWFMIALLFSPEAGAGVVLAIAVTFLTFFVRMDVKEIAVVSLLMLFSNIPGAFISKKMCKWVNPLNSFRLAELMFATVNALIAGTVTGATTKDKNLVYFYAALVGVAFGWMFPSQRTLAVALMPKGQETEIMGLISFFGQIVGWLPVFVFTVMNENGVSMRWGLASLSFFLVVSFLFTLLCGKFEDAVALVEHTSDEYLNDYKRKSGVLELDSFVEDDKEKEKPRGTDLPTDSD